MDPPTAPPFQMLSTGALADGRVKTVQQIYNTLHLAGVDVCVYIAAAVGLRCTAVACQRRSSHQDMLTVIDCLGVSLA